MQMVLVTSDEIYVWRKMQEMRKWLDSHRFEPSRFAYRVEGERALVEVTFTADREAAVFANAFKGTVTSAAAESTAS